MKGGWGEGGGGDYGNIPPSCGSQQLHINPEEKPAETLRLASTR